MMIAVRQISIPTALTLLLPLALLGAELGYLAYTHFDLSPPHSASTAVKAPDTVTLPDGKFLHRPSGSFWRSGLEIDAPLVPTDGAGGLRVMTTQVTSADYALCVKDAVCTPPSGLRRAGADLPVTGVNYQDALDYAGWLSAGTGENWRLPTDAEWSYFAGSKFTDDALGVSDNDQGNPAMRWIAAYEQAAALGTQIAAQPQPVRSLGANEFGLFDLSGAVWEWTQTCDRRTILAANGDVANTLLSCGVRVVAGRHRSAMNVFVRDARTGGCSVGAPPDNLGIRLVRDPNFVERLTKIFQR